MRSFVPCQQFKLSQTLALKVYGVVRSTNITEGMQQGYVILVNGKPAARNELPDVDRALVRAHLTKHFPEHTRIL